MCNLATNFVNILNDIKENMNEINCIYIADKDKNEINLLYDYNCNVSKWEENSIVKNCLWKQEI